MLTVISVDNVDILQSHAVVSALDAIRSWHGTSVQCIQPQPKSDELTQQEIVVSSQSQPDDSQSPIPVQRLKRRRRTLAEACSPHTQMVTPRHESTEDTYKAICNELDIQELSCTSLSLNNFLPTETELTHFNQLKVDIHKSMLLKYFRQSDDDQIFHLPTIPVLVNGVRKQVSEKEVGNVVYVDVLSEKADSKATLTKVVGKLHKIFVVDLKQMFVVGDAKVYDVLQSLRLEYGNHLNWLIPLPGDFHILYNYQKVVMKAYEDAGLITLAKSAGYRGETLTSLSKAKNFRRTHLFLLQTYEAFYNYFLSLYLSDSEHLEEGVYVSQIQCIIIVLLQRFKKITDANDEEIFRSEVQSKLLQPSYESMDRFMKALSQKQDTIKFWYSYITEIALLT